jgi:hypothetical protein
VGIDGTNEGEGTMPDAARNPIDAVYTWVDGSDARWRERRRQTLARLGERGARLDGSATSDVRFLSRDELRYSLRSLERFAPFIRKIHVVTDGQIPRWLDVHHPQLQIVFHDALFPDPSHLPTFSSRAIESHLHRIPGLSERFLYFNDDVLLSAPATPDSFFDEAGRARVYLDHRRVVWDPSDPRYEVSVNVGARSSSRLLEELGADRIEYRVAHTPYALSRTLLDELWCRFPKELEAASAHPFRTPGTVTPTSSLAQYYGFLTDRAIASETSQLTYFKVKKKPWSPQLLAWRLLRHRLSRANPTPFLSINDSGELDESRLTAASVALFFKSLHPKPSRFERKTETA